MFHISIWRERLRNSLTEVAEGRPQVLPPPAEMQDELNDKDLAGAIGIPLGDAAARCDHLLSEVMDLYDRIGDQPFEWYTARTTRAAVLRSSFIHTSNHIYAYYRENGRQDLANQVVDRAAETLRGVHAPELILGPAIYNSAIARLTEGHKDEAIELLREAMKLRPDLKEFAPTDADLEGLRDDPRFKELVSS